MEVVPDLPTSKEALAAISFIHHTGQAIYQLSQFITYPRQDLQAIHNCINAILEHKSGKQGSANKTVLQPALVNHYQKGFISLRGTQARFISTKRLLCCAPWTNGSLARDKEKELADECYHTAKSFKAASTAG